MKASVFGFQIRELREKAVRFLRVSVNPLSKLTVMIFTNGLCVKFFVAVDVVLQPRFPASVRKNGLIKIDSMFHASHIGQQLVSPHSFMGAQTHKLFPCGAV
jgi:hypothetical protein